MKARLENIIFNPTYFENGIKTIVLSKDFIREASLNMSDDNKQGIEILLLLESLSDFQHCSPILRTNILNMIYGCWKFADKTLEESLKKDR